MDICQVLGIILKGVKTELSSDSSQVSLFFAVILDPILDLILHHILDPILDPILYPILFHIYSCYG